MAGRGTKQIRSGRIEELITKYETELRHMQKWADEGNEKGIGYAEALEYIVKDLTALLPKGE